MSDGTGPTSDEAAAAPDVPPPPRESRVGRTIAASRRAPSGPEPRRRSLPTPDDPGAVLPGAGSGGRDLRAAPARPRRRAETGTSGSPADPGRPRPRLTRWELTVATGVLVVVALGITALALPSHKANAAAAGQAALAAGRRDLSSLLAITSASSTAEVQTALQATTPAFAASYADGDNAAKQLLSTGTLRSSGGVQALGLEAVHGGSATVLAVASAFVDGQQVSYRLVVTLKHTDGQWLITDLEVAK